MISDNSIQQVKGACDIVEIIGKHVTLKRDGTNMVGLCPFHNEKSPSFKVNKANQFYKCFGCGESGDAIAFIQKHKNKTYPEAIQEIADMYNIMLEDEIPLKDRVYVKPTPKVGELDDITLKYFLDRGISKKTLDALKVTQSVEWMPKAKAEINTICFNYYRDNELINIKYRGKGKDFKMSKDAELIFYNLDAIKGKQQVIITEGEIDCLSIREAGIGNVVSVPNGAATGRLEYMDNCYEMFSTATIIILMVDNDKAGLPLRDELARRFGYDRCLMVTYPDGCKDANDVLKIHGKDKLREIIQNASEFPIEGVFTMDEFEDEIQTFYEKGYPNGYKAGISGLDDHLQFMLGQYTTITGIPGSGKSEFVDYISVELSRNHGWVWGVCSFENQPSSIHATKIMEKYIRKSFAHRKDITDRMSIAEFNKAKDFVSSYFHFININRVDVTLDGILIKVKELIQRRGLKGALIDPWNYIEHKNEKGQTETQYISDCLTKVKAFCALNKVHIILIAHPTKIPKVNGAYEVPTLYNISGSAHFFNKTDNGVTIYRDFATNIVTVHVQKVRYGWLGKVGAVDFNYNINTRAYSSNVPEIEGFTEPPDNAHAGITNRLTTNDNSNLPF